MAHLLLKQIDVLLRYIPLILHFHMILWVFNCQRTISNRAHKLEGGERHGTHPDVFGHFIFHWTRHYGIAVSLRAVDPFRNTQYHHCSDYCRYGFIRGLWGNGGSQHRPAYKEKWVECSFMTVWPTGGFFMQAVNFNKRKGYLYSVKKFINL